MKKSRQALFDILEPNVEKWAIYQLGTDRKEFIDALTEEAMRHLRELFGHDSHRITEEIAKAMYLEKVRIKDEPWAVDPKDEKSFWGNVNEQLIDFSLKKPFEGERPEEAALFQSIIARYAGEIPGTFDTTAYRLATIVVPWLFYRLLNTASTKRLFRPRIPLSERLKITGDLEKIRLLSQHNTLLLTPTHFSNLDSLLVGWVINSLGLPAFLYGAGLNLFNSSTFGYFMHRLGAYKVDRRKKNTLYIETLKMYSRMTLQRGCHSLFFPGGTRSRSGQIETRLKMGLLGSAIDAQRLNFIAARQKQVQAQKIIVLPLVINYNFVLEASSLIDGYLKQSGREKYFIDRDDFPGVRKLLQFLWKFFGSKTEVVLSFGEPMDIFGNALDKNGQSVDKKGNVVDISNYFYSNGGFEPDPQRDAEYTKLLSEQIISQFYAANTVLAGHLVAFVAFEILARKHRRLDLYGLLRIPEEDRVIPIEQFLPIAERIRNAIKTMADNNRIKMADHLHGDIGRIVEYGALNLGVYHSKRALKFTQDHEALTSENLNLLYYYHNRLLGYALEELI